MMALILTPSSAPGLVDAPSPKAGTRSEATDPNAAESFGEILSRSLQPDEKTATDRNKTAAPVTTRRRPGEQKDDVQDLVNVMALAVPPLPGKAAKANPGDSADTAGNQAVTGAATLPLAGLAAHGVGTADTRSGAAVFTPGNDVPTTLVASSPKDDRQAALKPQPDVETKGARDGMPANAQESAARTIAPTAAVGSEQVTRNPGQAALQPQSDILADATRDGTTSATGNDVAVKDAALAALQTPFNTVAARDGATRMTGAEKTAGQLVAPSSIPTVALNDLPAVRQAPATAPKAQSGALTAAPHDGTTTVSEAAKATVQALVSTSAPGNDSSQRDDSARRQPGDTELKALNVGVAPSGPMPHGTAPAHGPAGAAESNAPPTVTVSSIAPEVGSSEWGKALGLQLTQLGRGAHQVAELQLNPPGLGPLKVTLNMNNQQMEALFVSAHSQVRAAVEAALPQLRTSLADSGISLGHTSVSADSQPQTAFSQAQGDSAGQRSYRDNARLSTQSVSAPALKPALRPAHGLSVDTYA